MWINQSSAWNIDQIDGLYINTSNYEPLSGSIYSITKKNRKFHEEFNKSQK